MTRHFIFLLIVFCYNSLFSQQTTVTDHKGTKQKVTSNTVSVTTLAPTDPVEGDLWFDTTSRITKVWRMGVPNGEWIPIQNSRLVIDADGDTHVKVEATSDEDQIRLYTNGSERMIITPGGNIGVGTAAPSQTLTVSGTAQIKGILFDSSGNIGTPGQFLSATPTGTLWRAGGESSTDSQTLAFDTITATSTKSTITLGNSQSLSLVASGTLSFSNSDSTTLLLTDQVSITPWKSSTTGTLYTVDALVGHEGALYKNLSGTNSTVSPAFDIANWLRISELTIDSLQATDTTASLSANQGRILNQLILALNTVPETQRTTAYLAASHTNDIILPANGISLPLNTNLESYGITHDTTSGNSDEIIFQSNAIYTLIVQCNASIDGGNRGDRFINAWLERDQGSGFSEITGTYSRIVLNNTNRNNESDRKNGAIEIAYVGFFAKNDKIRIKAIGEGNSTILKAGIGQATYPAVKILVFANSTGLNIQNEVNDIVDAATPPPTSLENDTYILTNVNALHPSWGTPVNLEENDVVLFNGTDWVVSLDVSTQTNKGEYQIYNLADDQIYYYNATTWVGFGMSTPLTYNSKRMIIDPNGNVGIGVSSPTNVLHISGQGRSESSNWTITSDKRLKEKIKNYTLGLEEILKIQPVTFQYNSLSENVTEKKQVGIIAQEIEKIIPQTVSLLDDSKGPTGIKDLRLFNASELIYTLINSVKSLNSKIERLETQNQQLQKKIDQFILHSQ